jgi:hypothetical protein
MSHDAVTIREDVCHEAGHDMVMLTKYEAPAGEYLGNGKWALAPDEYKDFDLWRARQIMTWLKTVYPGHFWAVVSDTAQGIVKIGIPILMGVQNWYVINLRQTELTIGTVTVAGGEILERYVLSRQRFNLGTFLDARRQHSALVVPSRRVPV